MMLDERVLVEISDLRVSFAGEEGEIIGVEDLDLVIRPGECLCVVGESGSGKSVSALSLMRLVEFGGGRIAGGRLMFDPGTAAPIDLAEAGPALMRDIRGNRIGMVFQEPMTALNPVFTIGDQLAEGLIRHRGLSKSAARARVIELLEQVRIPEPERRLAQYPHELSGGMRQRVVIAMAISCDPVLLICDEPTTALDVTIQAEILALIDRLKREQGMAVMFITHDMAVVAQIADRVAVMRGGRKIEEGPVAQIFASPQADYTKMLLAAVPKLGALPAGGGAPEISASAAPLLEVEHLVTRFPVKGGLLRRTVAQVHAVEDVSFTLHPGETLSLVGESGSGKSTCGRAILRLVAPSAGKVRLAGQDLSQLSPHALRLARRDMQMIFQDPFASLDPQMRLVDQVAEPLLNFGITSRAAREDRVAQLFDRVELPRSFMARYPHELSGGQRQRIAIARALALGPKLVVADEAVSALDVSVQAQVLDLLADLQKDTGIALLFISHDMAVVERISHRVAVMYLGRIVEIGPRARIFGAPSHPYTRRLLDAVPLPDPARRSPLREGAFRQIPSPIHPLGYQAPPSLYREVAPGHLVLTNPEIDS